jgi:hypothetical protein
LRGGGCGGGWSWHLCESNHVVVELTRVCPK